MNSRNRKTWEERERQILCDKRDNNYVWKNFPSNRVHLLLSTSFCKKPENMNVLWWSRQNTQVIVLSRLPHKCFAVFFFLSSCCVNSLTHWPVLKLAYLNNWWPGRGGWVRGIVSRWLFILALVPLDWFSVNCTVLVAVDPRSQKRQNIFTQLYFRKVSINKY